MRDVIAGRPPVPELGRRASGLYIENGTFPSGMPAARGILSDEEVWRIVFIRHLPPAGSLGEPTLYGAQ